ncbi:hypothetical protein V2J09_018852 [Rumex salicifolius]
MKACLSTIQQTLTPEAATVLNQSIAEAGRRNHGQTTPLHVAATLLASPTGFLRQACIRSHPNSSHPLQCRALELCFSVALERLPTTAAADNNSSSDPSLSNALMAALKRAQAHQRRGCPEQQQQPLLAVKVELIQFIISILDDPSVSRVMREASFSSPAVKAAIEQSLISPSSSSPSPHHPSSPAVSKIGLGFRPMPSTATPPPISGRGLYLNPRLQSQQQQQQQQSIINPNLGGQSSGDDVRKVIDILSRTRKKNPVLVGESEPETVLREVLRRIEKKELGDSGPLSNVEVVSMDKELGFLHSGAPLRLRELGGLIEMRMKMLVSAGAGLILDLGDLKWLVDQPPGFGMPHQGVSEVAREAVADMGKLISRFRGDDGGSGARLWVIGTATCETYLRCQVYHPKMENEWDLQAVSIAARAPLHSKFPRLVPNGMLSGPLESYSHLKSLSTTMQPSMRSEKSVPLNLDSSRKISCCPQCLENYEKEVSILSAGQPEKPVSEAQTQLPQWLQNAKTQNNDDIGALNLSQSKDHDPALKQKSQELMKKWSDRCLLLHPSFHQNSSHERINPKPLTLTSLYANPSLLARQSFQPKTNQARTLGTNLSLNMNSLTSQPTVRQQSPPLSPVRTDLVLGQTKTPESTTAPAPKNAHVDQVKDLLSCISSESPVKVSELHNDKPLDADTFKKLLKALIEKVWWQRDAASAVTTTVTRCKLGNGRKRAGGTKGDIWMLFSGPDRTGKKKMVTALSEQVCGAGPVIICLGSTRDKEESDMNFRGKTVLDRIAEAVRRNPFSVIMLQDIDEVDTLVRGSIKRAMERGRFTDSYGREISLGSIVFVLTAGNRAPLSRGGNQLDEEKLVSVTSSDWHLKVSVDERKKRRLSWLTEDGERASKQRRETSRSPSLSLSLSFDLNEMAGMDEDRVDGSHNSSDLTVEYEDENASNSHEFANLVDESIVFKPVEFGLLRKNVERTITARFRAVLGEKVSVGIESEALDKILGGAWLGNIGLDSWVEEALAPAIHQLKTTVSVSGSEPEECVFARLELEEKPEARKDGDWLPSTVAVSFMSVGGR